MVAIVDLSRRSVSPNKDVQHSRDLEFNRFHFSHFLPHRPLLTSLPLSQSASPESSAFLRDLVFGVALKGLGDREEDVCAAAARAVRLVTKRFLRLPWLAATGDEGVRTGSKRYTAKPSITGGYITDGRRGQDVVAKHQCGVRRAAGARIPLNVVGKAEAEEDKVFDLVWKALGALHRDSACVEVRG